MKQPTDVLQIALAAAGLGTFQLEPVGLIFHWDALCRKLLGINSERSSADVFLERIDPRDRERLLGTFRSVTTRAPNTSSVREDFETASGSTFELRGTVVFEDGRVISLVGSLRDVTEQRESDQEREQRIDELSRTVLFSEMFVGILAHDLKQPISGMIMAAQLAGKLTHDEAVQALLTRIGTMGARTTRMVDQLLDYTSARVGSGIPLRPAKADLAAIARGVVGELTAPHRVHVESVGATTGSWDEDRLVQALSNVLGNAIEHGVIDSDVRVVIDGTQPFEVVVEVRNEGVVEPELVPMLFYPFRAARQKRDRSRGIGLGLYVTRQIAVAHGGDVTATSSADEGTCLRMRLPRETPAQRVPPSAPMDEMLALERFSSAPRLTPIAAQLFGAASLEERAPRAYRQLCEQYDALLELLVRQRVFKGTEDDVAKISDEIRAIAERLGALNAGAREVAELHAQAIRKRTLGAAAPKSQALITEGRMMAFELMGRLLSYYRRRAGFTGVGASTA